MPWVTRGTRCSNIRRLSWVAHQLPRDPSRLFDANIFYPELRTLAYSDAMLATALMAAPLLWLGVHHILVYNIVLLLSFAASGVAMYALARALTGDRAAAFVAGVAFAFYPFRFEHYSHLELQVTFWMPLALLMMHRTMTTLRARDGAVTGLLVALQTRRRWTLAGLVSAGRHGCGVAGDRRTEARRTASCALGCGGGRSRRPGAPGRRALPSEPGAARRAARLGGAHLQRDAAELRRGARAQLALRRPARRSANAGGQPLSGSRHRRARAGRSLAAPDEEPGRLRPGCAGGVRRLARRERHRLSDAARRGPAVPRPPCTGPVQHSRRAVAVGAGCLLVSGDFDSRPG